MTAVRFWAYAAAAVAAAAAIGAFSPQAAPVASALSSIPAFGTPSAPPASRTDAPAITAGPAMGRSAFEPALRDPFLAGAAPAAPAPPQRPTAPVQVQKPPESPAAPAAAPPLDLRYAGQMTAPDGKHVVYAMHGQETVVLAAGIELPNGYRVEKISPRAVELVYPGFNTPARLDIPLPPPFELR